MKLQFTWYRYLLVLLLPILLWTSVFDILRQPAKNEQLGVLYIGSELDEQALHAELSHVLSMQGFNKIKQIRADSLNLEGADYYSVLTARCFDYDILIFQESQMREHMGLDIFARLTEQMLSAFPTAEPYQEVSEDADVLTFGFYIPENANFSRFYSGRESCVLFVSPYSIHFGSLNENGSSGDDAALKAAQYLLETDK